MVTISHVTLLSRMSLGGGQEVFITVRVAESDYFRREGQDVHTTAYISLSQALLGGVIRITGLHGDLNLRIPQVTLNSQIGKHVITHESDRVSTQLGYGITNPVSFGMVMP